MSRLSRSRISCRMRRGQDAAVPEGARPELRGAVHPADHAAGGERVGDSFDEHGVVELRDVLVVLARRARQVLGVDDRSPEGMIGDLPVRVAGDRCGRHRAPRRARSRHRRAPAARTRARSRTPARIRALATPFSATPPPKHRSGRPVSRWSARAMSTSVSSRTRCTLAAQSAKRRPSAVSRSIGS